MTNEYHINVEREEMTTRVAVADEDGVIIDVREFATVPTDGDMNTREFRALAWTMGVLLRRHVPYCRTAHRPRKNVPLKMRTPEAAF